MKTIYKYILTGRGGIQMPKGADIIQCNMQGLHHCIWAIIDTNAPLETRTFEIVGTGWELDSNMKYIGTCFDKDFVWHIMEII
jgi:hypothetical protein